MAVSDAAAVFGGMLVSTFLNLFIIPVLYVLVRSMLPGQAREEGDAPIEQTAD